MAKRDSYGSIPPTPSTSGKGSSMESSSTLNRLSSIKKSASKLTKRIPNNKGKIISSFNTFGKPEDNIELNVYDNTNTLVAHLRDFKDYTFTEEGKTNEGLFNEIVVDPVTNLKNLNFNSGQFNLEYRFQRKKIVNTFKKVFFIKEISNSRREIRVDNNDLNNIQLQQRYDIFKNELEDSSIFKDFTLNFGNGINITAVNIFLDKSQDNNSLLIKLIDPLPLTIANTFTFRIVEDLIEPATIPVSLELSSLEDPTIKIAGPNFKIDTRLNSSIPSEFKTYDELLEGGITSSYENVLNSLSSSSEPNVEYNNPTTDSGYHFENFTHFGSAVEKLNNFKYKIKLLELYDSQVNNINTIIGNASSSATVLGSKNIIETKKKKLIGGFDGYERFLYYESGAYSWPKSNLTKPYIQYAISTSQALTWFGDNEGVNPYYGGQIYSASQFDNQNVYNLNKLIPEYIKNDSNNDQYKLFVDMIGQHFDQSWLYIKSLTENKRAENKLNRGIDKDLVYNALKGLGIQVFDEFENEDLFGYLTGINKDGSLLHQTGLGITLVTASNDGSLPKADITKEKWKRIYHNLPYLLKTKGTERGIRALITSYGIPSTILNVKEFGGSTTDNTTYKTFRNDKFSFALSTDQLSPNINDEIITTIGGGSILKTDWSSSLTDALSSSAKTIEFQLKPEYNSNIQNILSFQKSSVVGISKPTGSFSGSLCLIIEPHIGNDVLEFGDKNNYGYLSLLEQKENNGNPNNNPLDDIRLVKTEKFPIFNGEFWNIFIGTEGTSGSSANVEFGAYQANHLGNISKYVTQSLLTEASRSINFGDPFFNGKNHGGASQIIWGNLINFGETRNTNLHNKPLLGSIKEIRYYFGELLSNSTLQKHALVSSMYGGNTPSSAYESLVLRLPLGNNLQQNTHSYHPNIDVKYLPVELGSNYFFPELLYYTASFNSHEYVEHLITPDTVGKSMTSEKVRLDSGEVEDNILSPDIKTETSVLDRQPTDSPDLGVYFSPSYEINKDIIYQLGSFRLDDYIGDPTHISENNYPDLKTLSNEYFKKPMDRFKYTDFIDITKQFDHTLFKMIESMVPAKANLKTGILIEPHYLERSKFANSSTLPGIEKHNNYEVNYDIKYTSETSDFNLSGQNLLTEIDFNMTPESQYVSFDNNSNFLLNNATKGRTSKKYFRTITSKTEEF